jgi:hypothetical protein
MKAFDVFARGKRLLCAVGALRPPTLYMITELSIGFAEPDAGFSIVH